MMTDSEKVASVTRPINWTRANRELATALRDLLREVRKVNDVLLPDDFDARAIRNAESALAAHGVALPLKEQP
jgi:hypothetical protein